MVPGIVRNRFVRWAAATVVVVAGTFVGRHFWNEHLLATARVRLVHADGRPAAGVPVEARWTRRNGGTGLARTNSRVDGGVALDRIAQDEYPALWSYRLRVHLPGAAGEWHDLASELSIVAPELAALAVVVQDRDGKPWSGEELRGTLLWADERRQIVLPNGRTETPVAAGSRLTLDLALHGHRFRETVDVTPRAGGKHDVALRLPQDALVVTGRCVDGAGRPTIGELLVQTGDGRRMARVTLRPDGGFRFAVGTGCTLPVSLQFHSARGAMVEKQVEALDERGEGALGQFVFR